VHRVRKLPDERNRTETPYLVGVVGPALGMPLPEGIPRFGVVQVQEYQLAEVDLQRGELQDVTRDVPEGNKSLGEAWQRLPRARTEDHRHQLRVFILAHAVDQIPDSPGQHGSQARVRSVRACQGDAVPRVGLRLGLAGAVVTWNARLHVSFGLCRPDTGAAVAGGLGPDLVVSVAVERLRGSGLRVRLDDDVISLADADQDRNVHVWIDGNRR